MRLAALFHDLGKPVVAWRGTDGRLHYYAKPGYSNAQPRAGQRGARDRALRRLRYPNALRERVVRIVRHHMFRPGTADPQRGRRFLAKHGDEVAFELLDHKEADLRGKRGSDGEPPPAEELERLARFRAAVEAERGSPHRLADLAVGGDDLIAVGFRPGPAVGHALRELLDEVVDDPELNTRDELLRRARRMAGTKT